MFENYRVVKRSSFPAYLDRHIVQLMINSDGGNYLYICPEELYQEVLPLLIEEAQAVFGWLLENGAVPGENILIEVG